MARPLIISDHALHRWLQRTGVLDIELVRQMLAASLARAAGAAQQLGQAEYLVVVDGLSYVVRNGTLVTVLYDNGPIQHAGAISRTSAAQREADPA